HDVTGGSHLDEQLSVGEQLGTLRRERRQEIGMILRRPLMERDGNRRRLGREQGHLPRAAYKVRPSLLGRINVRGGRLYACRQAFIGGGQHDGAEVARQRNGGQEHRCLRWEEHYRAVRNVEGHELLTKGRELTCSHFRGVVVELPVSLQQ